MILVYSMTAFKEGILYFITVLKIQTAQVLWKFVYSQICLSFPFFFILSLCIHVFKTISLWPYYNGLCRINVLYIRDVSIFLTVQFIEVDQNWGEFVENIKSNPNQHLWCIKHKRMSTWSILFMLLTQHLNLVVNEINKWLVISA